MPEITPLTPARVAIVDPATGGVTRPWYMFFQSLYQSAQNAVLNYIGAAPPADGQLLRYDAAGQGWTNSVGATVDAEGNATVNAVRVTDAFPSVDFGELGVFLEYEGSTGILRSTSGDVDSTGELWFYMTNSDGTLTRLARFDDVGNFYIPGQMSGGFLSNGINIADQQLDLYTVVQNTISANITMTTRVATLGSRADIIILTSGTTSRTVTFGTGFKTTGTLATGTASGKYFVISFVSNGSFMIETSRTVAM